MECKQTSMQMILSNGLELLNISRFLWVAFQIDSICSQKTDAAILTALKDLPKDLPDTFNRILQKLQHSNTADPHFSKKVFDLVAAAQRPLTVAELREAVSVEPGEETWDTSKLVNEMLKSLLDCCGSLVNVDEEHLTVHFAHHSVKQYLLSEPTNSEMRKYHINMKHADLYLGGIIVTYLNFGIFDQRLIKTNQTMQRQAINYPSAILGGLSRSSITNKWAVRLLKSRGDSRIDIQSQLRTAAGILDGSKEPAQPAHFFLSYAQEHWLFHTKAFAPGRIPTYANYRQWANLVDGWVDAVKMPLQWTEQNNKRMEMIERMKWSIQNENWALIHLLLEMIGWDRHHKGTKFLLQFLENQATDTSGQIKDFVPALYIASYLNNKIVVLLSLRRGVNINEGYGFHGTALQAASRAGNEEIVRLLLEHKADVNAEGETYGYALHAASTFGHEGTTRILLENGANVNADDGVYGTALHAPSRFGHEGITRLLLENGANVNADPGVYGTALYAASRHGHEGTARILLKNGANVNANVNAEDEPHQTALHIASKNGHEGTARLLLENGANVNAEDGLHGTALRATITGDHEGIARLLLEYGADITAWDSLGRTPLDEAISSGAKGVVRTLLKKSSSCQTSVLTPPLLRSCKRCTTSVTLYGAIRVIETSH